MKFKPPPGAKTFKGAYGFPATAYILKGNTGGAEFRIEQENPDGSRDLMYSERLRPRSNPADRGLKRFALELSESGQGMLVLRSVSLTEGTPAADLTCWAEIGFE